MWTHSISKDSCKLTIQLPTCNSQAAPHQSTQSPLVRIFQSFQVSIYNQEKTFHYMWCSDDQRNRLKLPCNLKRNQNASVGMINDDNKCVDFLPILFHINAYETIGLMEWRDRSPSYVLHQKFDNYADIGSAHFSSMPKPAQWAFLWCFRTKTCFGHTKDGLRVTSHIALLHLTHFLEWYNHDFARNDQGNVS